MNNQQQPTYIKLQRKNSQLVLPLFWGTEDPDIESWIAELETLFEIHGIWDDERVEIACNAIAGTARFWLSRMQCQGKNLIVKFRSESWNTFKGEIKTNFFNPNRQLKLKEKLKSMKQGDSSIYNHVMAFRELAALLPNLPESEKVQIFCQSCQNVLQHPHAEFSSLENAFEASFLTKET
jgi:hypothetical protein